MECRHCRAKLEAIFDNGVIDHYKFINPLPGCCCEVDIEERDVEEIESDPTIIRMGELADSINEHTETIKRMDEHENRT